MQREMAKRAKKREINNRLCNYQSKIHGNY